MGMRVHKFHGRYEDSGRECEHPACHEPGEFRAPGTRGNSFDGPGEWRWMCLDHVREFNSGYDWFDGMSADEILAAQSPVTGWERETRAFARTGADGTPRWADFADPLDAIGARAGELKARVAGRSGEWSRYTPREREAMAVMGLSPDADRTRLRRRYSELVRRYHPDRNGGDRRHEARLGRVVEAYQLLRASRVFA